jgi:hypothetical protein
MPLHAVVVSKFRFIPPCRPVPAKAVPAGDGWVHELKFDGYRVQAHKIGSRVVLFSRNGHDFTERFASIAALLREMSAKAAVLVGEVVRCQRSSELRPASRAVDKAGRYPSVGVRLARPQWAGLVLASTRQAPGAPAGVVGALWLPGCLPVRDLHGRRSAAARGRGTPP